MYLSSKNGLLDEWEKDTEQFPLPGTTLSHLWTYDTMSFVKMLVRGTGIRGFVVANSSNGCTPRGAPHCGARQGGRGGGTSQLLLSSQVMYPYAKLSPCSTIQRVRAALWPTMVTLVLGGGEGPPMV